MTKIIHWRDFGAALVILAIGVAFLIWAQSYPPRSSTMPTLVAWLTIVLALIDAAARTETRLGRFLGRIASADNVIEWKTEGDEAASTRKIALSIFWILAYLVAVVLVGFLLATPCYIFVYMLLHGRKSVRAAAISTVVTTAVIWFTFEKVFRYPLYPGMLFGGY